MARGDPVAHGAAELSRFGLPVHLVDERFPPQATEALEGWRAASGSASGGCSARTSTAAAAVILGRWFAGERQMNEGNTNDERPAA
jgi:RNase H-fold protein (predicted Holliday junction resolvase)